jgi:CheY-like chemotaxis protein
LVAVTGSVWATHRDRLQASGFDGFLAKPVNAEDLLTCLQGA